MKMRTLFCGFVCGAVCTLLPAGIASMSGPELSDDALRQAAKESGTISSFHKDLRKVKGKYDNAVKWWRAPDAPPDELACQSDTDWLIEGRFLMQRIQGRWLDLPLEAVVILGYDNMTEEFNSVWFDSLGTRILYASGKADDAGQVITLHGQFTDMVTRESVDARAVLQMPDKKGETKLEVYRKGTDGNEFKCLEVATTRRIMRGA